MPKRTGKPPKKKPHEGNGHAAQSKDGAATTGETSADAPRLPDAQFIPVAENLHPPQLAAGPRRTKEKEESEGLSDLIKSQEVRDAVDEHKGDPTDYGRWRRWVSPKFDPVVNIVDGATDEMNIGSEVENHGEPLQVRTMADAAQKIQSVKYAIPQWVPFGMVSMLMSEPGVGKSAFALLGMARPFLLGNHTPFFNGSKGPADPGCVLYLDTESSLAITVHRALKNDLPIDRLLLFGAEDVFKAPNLSDADDLNRIRNVVTTHGPKLVIVDSLRGAHSTDENSSKVVSIMQSLGDIASQTGTAVVVIHHTRKLWKDEEVTANASRGSNAIHAMVRTQIAIDRPDPESRWCRVSMLKENLGLHPEPFGFIFENDGLTFGPAPVKPGKNTRQRRCQEKIIESMNPGQWYKTASINKLLVKQFPTTTIHHAKEALGITAAEGNVRKVGEQWECRLPSN